jgi:hypothetical protein
MVGCEVVQDSYLTVSTAGVSQYLCDSVVQFLDMSERLVSFFPREEAVSSRKGCV